MTRDQEEKVEAKLDNIKYRWDAGLPVSENEVLLYRTKRGLK